MNFGEKHYKILKWCILLLAYGFLTFRLVTFDKYDLLHKQWQEFTLEQFYWLILTLLLLPLNWWLESVKWRMIVSDIEQLSPLTAFKSVLAGITSGFFTPNRLGEFAGRVAFLEKKNWLTASAISFVGTLAQNIAILTIGVPAALLFFAQRQQIDQIPLQELILFFSVIAVFFVVIYLCLPQIANLFLQRNNCRQQIKTILHAIKCFSTNKLFKIFALSLVRYTVFCTQFYFVLCFLGVVLSPLQAIIGIATNYLFVTFTPAIALSEVAIRGSYALLFIGTFSENLVGVVASGVIIWLINYCLPLLVGSLFLAKTKLK